MNTTLAAALIACVIKYPAPPAYDARPLPAGTIYRALSLVEVQRAYQNFTGKRNFGACGVLGFLVPGEPPTIFYATDVSCRDEVRRHEEAHAKGWPAGHPGSHAQQGPCSNA